MNRLRTITWTVIVLTPFALSASKPARGAPPNVIAPSEERQEEFRELIEQAKTDVGKRQVVGKQLLRILQDEKAWVDYRVRAGAMLGEMHYLPAIPALIQNAHLRSSRSREPSGSQLGVALRRFGPYAVPAIVDEILKLDLANVDRPGFLVEVARPDVNSARLFVLATALGGGSKRESADRRQLIRVYLTRIAAASKNRTIRQRAKAWLKRLARLESKRRTNNRKPPVRHGRR